MGRAIRTSALLGLVVLAACGTRLSTEEILVENRGRVDTSGRSPMDTPTDLGGSQGLGDADASAPIGASFDSSSGGQGPDGAAERQAVSQTRPAKKPIVLGLIGYFSGIGGSVHIPKRDAFLAWERLVNGRGGILGHPVKVLWGDDGGDPARAIAIARDFVEAKGAIALSLTGSVEGDVMRYAESKSIPVIGVGTGPTAEAKNSPMMFSTSPGGTEITWGFAALAKRAGVHKVGVLFCVESASCEETANEFATSAEEQSLEVVVRLRASVAQPDYTAECLQARNAGAELLFTVIDSASPVRMAASCGRQDYRPIWQLASPADFQAKVPEFDGAIAASDAFPWVLRDGAPGVLEYVEAFKRFNPKRLDGDGSRDQASAWVAVKVFERAARAVSDNPTSEDILRGLWAIRGDTLDGLAPGRLARTFVKGSPPADSYCVFGVRVQDERWVATAGLTPVCR